MKPFPPELNKTGSGPQPLTTSKDIFKRPFLRHFHGAASTWEKQIPGKVNRSIFELMEITEGLVSLRDFITKAVNSGQ